MRDYSNSFASCSRLTRHAARADLALTEIADTLIDVLNRDGPQAVIQGSGTRVKMGRAERKLGNGLNEQRERIWQN